MVKKWRCEDCGWEGTESKLKTVVGDLADCSYGEYKVCPDCGSENVSQN